MSDRKIQLCRPRYGAADLLRRVAAEAADRGERVLICCASEASAELWAGVRGAETTCPGRQVVGARVAYVVDDCTADDGGARE